MNNLFTSDVPQIVSSDRILYTASSFARSSLLHLQEIGSLTALQPHESSRSNLNSYLFFTVVSGSGILTYEGTEHELKEHSCVFIDCNKPYTHATSTDLWTLKWTHFNGSTMASIYEKYKERGGRAVFVPQDEILESLMDVHRALMEIAQSIDYMRDMLINQELSRLLTLIMSESWHPEDQEAVDQGAGLKKQTIVTVKQYLDQNYNERISLDDLSARIFIDKFYLGKSFKEQFGSTINSYLMNLRITRAKQLLRFTNKTVEEIGYEVGIGAPAYFSRMFKEIEGVSPKVYREQW